MKGLVKDGESHAICSRSECRPIDVSCCLSPPENRGERAIEIQLTSTAHLVLRDNKSGLSSVPLVSCQEIWPYEVKRKAQLKKA